MRILPKSYFLHVQIEPEQSQAHVVDLEQSQVHKVQPLHEQP